MEGHAKTCVERYCELANKHIEQLYGVSALCINDHRFKEEELESFGELSNVCPQIVLKCLWRASTDRHSVSVNRHNMDKSLRQTPV